MPSAQKINTKKRYSKSSSGVRVRLVYVSNLFSNPSSLTLFPNPSPKGRVELVLLRVVVVLF